MSVTTSKSAVILNQASAIIAALTCAFAITLVIGIAPAYAEGENAAAAADNAPTTPANSAVDANAAATALEIGANDAAAPASEAATTVVNSENASADTALAAAAGPASYPGDDKSDDIFIGLAPVTTDTEATAPYGDLPANATITPSANGDVVYVGITSKVGQAVDLAVMVDYVRVNADAYGEGDTAVLPMTLTSDSLSRNASDYFAVNWYYGDSPLAQGTYYSDLAEYLRVTGSTSAGSAQALPATPAKIEGPAFHYWTTRHGYPSGSGKIRPDISSPYERFRIDELYAQDGSNGCSFSVGTTDIIKACEGDMFYDQNANMKKVKVLFFEESGPRVITAQATYLREIINGSDVSYIVYASVPVVFYIDVEGANQGTFTVNAVNSSNTAVDISSFGDSHFSTAVFKKYKHLDDYTEDSEGISENYQYEGENYVFLCEGNSYRNYAAAGIYKIAAYDRDGAYRTRVETFIVSNSAFAGNATVTKQVTLHSAGEPDSYKARFVDENGDELLAEALYVDGTPGSSVATPATTPVKNEDTTSYYAFDYWTVVEAGNGTLTPLDVTDNYTYKAHYKTISKTDTMSAGGVGASGGIFTDPNRPGTVASYELSVNPISSTASSVTSSMSIIGPNNSVLGAYEVDITQHNVDGTTAKVTTGVGALTLEFPVSGVADGTTVQIIQVHASTGANDPAETMKHTGVVNNGKVSVTVGNKLSTFIVATNLESQGAEEGEQGGSSDDPSNGNTSGDPATSDSTSKTTNEESTTPAESGDPVTNDDDSATRGMPAAEPELGPDGVLADGPGDDIASEGIKAAPGADEGKLPATGDMGHGLLPVALIVLSAVVAAWALSARRRQAER